MARTKPSSSLLGSSRADPRWTWRAVGLDQRRSWLRLDDVVLGFDGLVSALQFRIQGIRNSPNASAAGGIERLAGRYRHTSRTASGFVMRRIVSPSGRARTPT